MRATLMYGAGDVRVEEVPDASMKEPTDALVRVVLACICGSDLWPYRSLPASAHGRRMGHEFVEDVGADVSGVVRGDPVVAPFLWSDNTCDFCRQGLHSSCRNGGGWGHDLDGGQGEAVRVPQAQGTLVRLPVAADSALLPSLLPLSDVLCTGHHAARTAGILVTASAGAGGHHTNPTLALADHIGAALTGSVVLLAAALVPVLTLVVPGELARKQAHHRVRADHGAFTDEGVHTVSTRNRLITLNNGVQMPILGFGVFQIPAEQTEQVVTDALAAGYRLLDTAAACGNEEAVGRAIKNSGIPREELVVTTKLWVQDTGEDNTTRAFDAALRRLGLDYLDLYLIHQPFGDVYGSWRAMEGLYREGRVKAIGVANFYPDRLVDLIEHNDVTPAVNQIETHPFFQRTADQELMRERGVQHQSWGPFAEGRNNLFPDPILTEIGAGYGKSVAQVVLRWLIQRDVVVIPKSVRADRMAQNIDVFDFELTDEQMARITTMDTGASLFFDHRDPAMVSQLSSVRIHD